MATVTFDPATRLITPASGPVGGIISINVQTDVYSDGKEAWLADAALNRFRFPVEAIGGQPVPGGKLGTTYILSHGWQLKPYEADHTFTIVGNIFTDDGSPVVAPTAGSFAVVTELQTSTLVEFRDASDNADLTLLRKVLTNRKITDPSTGIITVFDDDGSALLSAQIFEDAAGTVPYRGSGLERQERLQ